MQSYKLSSNEIIKQFLNCTYSEQQNEGIRILNLDDSYLDESGKCIKNLFFKVEEKSRIVNGFNALEQFKKRIENVELKEINVTDMKKQNCLDKETDDSLDKKFINILKISKEKIKNLMLQEKGNVNKPEENMLKKPFKNVSRTNAELIGFKLGKAPDNIEISKERLNYLDDAFQDLDNYCKDIIYNYNNLKIYILNNYNK